MASSTTGQTDVLETLRSRWQLVVAVTVVAAILGGLGSLLQPERYQATVELLLADPVDLAVPGGTAGSDEPERRLRNETALVNSDAVYQRAADLAGGSLTLQDFRDSVSASSAGEYDAITIEAAAPTPETAAAMANAMGEAYVDLSAQRVEERAQRLIDVLEEQRAAVETEIAGLDPEAAGAARVQALQEQLASIAERIDTVQLTAGAYESGVTLLDTADGTDDAVVQLQPRPVVAAIVSGIAGFVVAVVLVLLADRVRTPASEPRRPSRTRPAGSRGDDRRAGVTVGSSGPRSTK